MTSLISSMSVGEIENKIGGMSEDEMRAWVNGLTDSEIRAVHANRYWPVYLNLLAIFHKKLSIAEIARIAAECTRNAIWSNRVLDRWMETLPHSVVSGEKPLLRLKGFDPELLVSLSSNSLGVIICSFRLGQYSLLPLEIALQGYDVVWPVKDAIFPELDSLAQSLAQRIEALPQNPQSGGGTRVENAKRMRFLPVGERTTSLKLVKALREGKMVLMQADGNGGVSGSGANSRKSIQFMDFPVSVKTGIAHLSWVTHAPILPMIALMDGMDSGQVICGQPIFRPDSNSPATRDHFEQETMQTLYSFFGKYALANPEQWPGVAPVHRWRRGPAAVTSATLMEKDEAGMQVRRELSQGGRYILNESSGVAAVATHDNWILVDMKSLKSFQAPSWAAGVMRKLCEGSGVGHNAIEDAVGEASNLRAEDVLGLLSEFKRQGLIAVG